MNKIQIRAEILTLITKLETTPAVSDDMFKALDEEPDKQAIMDVLLKELQRAKEQKAFVICYILTRLFEKDVTEGCVMEWTMTGFYEDGFEVTVYGNSSKECIYSLMDDYEEEHGELIRYLGYNGSEYIEGEAI